MRITLLCCLILLSFSGELRAQNFPIGALPTKYNGGFAGEAGEPRVASFSYFKSWLPSSSKVQGDLYKTSGGTFISADHFLKKLRSGIAITAGYEAYDNDYKIASTSLAISPKFSFKGKYTVAPFVDFSFAKSNLNKEPNDFYVPSIFLTNYFKIKTGLLLNSSRAYVGISADVLQYRPFIVYNNHIMFLSEREYVLQAGYTFQRKAESNFSFTPQLAISYRLFTSKYPQTLTIRKYGYSELLDLNLMFRYKKFIAGLNNTGLAIGYQSNKLKFQVNSNIGNLNWYTGSISLRYIFRKDTSVKMPGFKN